MQHAALAGEGGLGRLARLINGDNMGVIGTQGVLVAGDTT